VEAEPNVQSSMVLIEQTSAVPLKDNEQVSEKVNTTDQYNNSDM